MRGKIKFVAWMIVLFCCNKQVSAQYASDTYLYRDVLSSLQIDSVFVSDKTNGDHQASEIKIFNSKGYIISSIDIDGKTYYNYLYHKDTQLIADYFYSKNNNGTWDLVEKDTFIYDIKGRLIKQSVSDILSPNLNYMSSVYEYKNDSLVSSTSYWGSDWNGTTSYTYNTNTKKESNVNHLEQTSETFFYYNTKGQLIAFRVLDEKGDTIVVHQYKLDEYGRRTEFAAYNSNGQLIQLYLMTYDKKGLLLYEEAYVEIKENNLKKAEYSRKNYNYSFRK